LKAGLLWIIIKLETALTEYQRVFDERLPEIEKIVGAMPDLERDEKVYFEYFRASITKRIG